MKIRRMLKFIYLGFLLLFLYAPIFALIVYSFNDSKVMGPWKGFTLRWYVELFQNAQLLEALYYTLAIAVLSSVIATVAGTAAAIGIHQLSGKKKALVLHLNNLPILNPDIVTGLSLMILFVFLFSIVGGGALGFGTMLAAHITFNIPYVILSVMPKLKQLDENLLEAAMDLGATPLSAYCKVILPEIMPGVFAGLLLSFTLSIDDFVISFFTTGPGVSNLSIYIYSTARRGVSPTVNALSAIMFLTIMLLLYLINHKDLKERKRKIEKI